MWNSYSVIVVISQSVDSNLWSANNSITRYRRSTFSNINRCLYLYNLQYHLHRKGNKGLFGF